MSQLSFSAISNFSLDEQVFIWPRISKMIYGLHINMFELLLKMTLLDSMVSKDSAILFFLRYFKFDTSLSSIFRLETLKSEIE